MAGAYTQHENKYIYVYQRCSVELLHCRLLVYVRGVHFLTLAAVALSHIRCGKSHPDVLQKNKQTKKNPLSCSVEQLKQIIHWERWGRYQCSHHVAFSSHVANKKVINTCYKLYLWKHTSVHKIKQLQYILYKHDKQDILNQASVPVPRECKDTCVMKLNNWLQAKVLKLGLSAASTAGQSPYLNLILLECKYF